MGTKKDLCFLKEMLERIDEVPADITQMEYVKTMIKDWINELERKIAKVNRSKIRLVHRQAAKDAGNTRLETSDKSAQSECNGGLSWPCQQLLGGTGEGIYHNIDGMCTHPECHPINDDRIKR